jgi:selenocysteine-specific elongation factor
MRSVVIGTAGHIDHGKSALVHALTGTDPDRLKEEKARGITIDLGFAHLRDGDVNLAFIDVPGHERFVKNMLAGAGGIDAVMLVVAADESVMPQTREHFEICRLLRVPAGVIALTKADLADGDMRELAALDVRELVAGSFLADAPILPVSSKTGEGMDALRTALAALARAVAPRDVHGPPRLPIDRVFTVRGFGTVVTGTLVSGEIREEQELTVLPRSLAVKVRGIQVHGRAAPSASAGSRVALNLGGIEVGDLARGDTLGDAAALEVARRIDVWLDVLSGARPLRHGTRVRFHQGTIELLGRVAIAGVQRGGEGASEVPPGGGAYARIRLEAPAVLTRGDRFILRAYSPPVTIAGGVVLDPQPPRGAIRTAAGLARFRALAADAPPERAVAAFIAERAGLGLPRASLVSRAGLTPAAASSIIERLTASRDAVQAGDLLVAPAVIDALATELLEALRGHHAADPLSEGLPREEARERVFRRAAPEVFDYAIAQLVGARRIVARDRLALEGHQLSLTAEEARARDAIEALFRDAQMAPPDLAGAASAAHTTGAVADRMVKLLVRQRRLVKVDTLFFHADSLERLKTEVRALRGSAEQARVDVAAFKEKYGISRKYAIPLLEYLDRERVTRRIGDARVVL